MRWFTRPQMVTHPGTNRVWRSATTLIEANALPLSQTAKPPRRCPPWKISLLSEFLPIWYTASCHSQQAVYQTGKNSRTQPYITLTDTFFAYYYHQNNADKDKNYGRIQHSCAWLCLMVLTRMNVTSWVINYCTISMDTKAIRCN